MHGKRIVSVLLVGALIFGTGLQAKASSIQDAQQKANEIQQQKNAAQAEQNNLAEQLKSVVADMDETKADIDKKQEEITKKADELMMAQLDESNQYENMKLRIKYMYENGSNQLIEVLLESKSIGEFLSNAEYINQISEYDRNMLVEFQKVVEQVEKQQQELEKESKELEKMRTELQAKQSEVESLLATKSAEISGLDSQLNDINQKIANLKAEEEKRKWTPPSPGPGPSIPPTGNGMLKNPCPSARISSEFGPRESPGGIGSTNHQGRDYAAPAGTPIYASAAGRVSTVQLTDSSARGLYVMIDHGNGLSTLYQHCSAIYVQQGQYVEAGQNIAAVGSTGASTGAHLHFEVWVKGTPVDPRLYL